MEVKLESLIEKIREEGVQAAKQESERIVKEAEEKGAGIVAKAKAEAERIVKDAGKQSEQLQENGRQALNQAARDVVLLVKQQISSLFDKSFKQGIAQSLSPDFLQEMIIKIIEGWAAGKDTEVLLGKKDVEQLRQRLLSKVRSELKNSVVIKTDERIESGFKVGLKGEDLFYDFSDQAIFESLRELLSPALTEMMDIKNG